MAGGAVGFGRSWACRGRGWPQIVAKSWQGRREERTSDCSLHWASADRVAGAAIRQRYSKCRYP